MGRLTWFSWAGGCINLSGAPDNNLRLQRATMQLLSLGKCRNSGSCL